MRLSSLTQRICCVATKQCHMVAATQQQPQQQHQLHLQLLRLSAATVYGSRRRHYSSMPSSRVKLEHVGCLTPVKTSERYEPGQMFVHRLFGYRGIVLAGYQARLFDKTESSLAATSQQSTTAAAAAAASTGPDTGVDSASTATASSSSSDADGQQQPKSQQQKEAGSSTSSTTTTATADSAPCLWYLVLVDQRDSNPSLRDGFTFLPVRPEPAITMMSAVDYCSHGDLLPYEPCSQPPVMDNPWFADFFVTGQAFGPTGMLQNWLHKMRRLLQAECVYRETTDHVRVTVLPFYMGSRGVSGGGGGGDSTTHHWRYMIRLENLDPAGRPVVLRERYWKIFSAGGTIETLKGRGVVGAEPELGERFPVFQYHSHVQLRAPWGYMWGCYGMERTLPQPPAEGAVPLPTEQLQFEVKIPVFSLSQKPSGPVGHD